MERAVVRQIKNPDPAWPEILAFVVLILLCAADGLSELSLGAYLAQNWWPILRIVLVVWGIARVIDFLRGGPGNRRAMRVAVRAMNAHLAAIDRQSKSF